MVTAVTKLYNLTDIWSARSEILWVLNRDIATACADDRFCPDGSITRGESAALLARALDLPPTSRDHFRDDNDSPFQNEIDRLAEAEIARGCRPGDFCPEHNISRGQVAALLSRALDLSPPVRDHYTDDTDHLFEHDLDLLAEADIAQGCAADRFCPGEDMTRQEIAVLIYRAREFL